MSALTINITPEDQRFAAEYKAREIEAEKLARGEGFTVNKNVGKYSASTADGSVTQHQVYTSSPTDFESPGVVGSLGLKAALPTSVVKTPVGEMQLSMAEKMGFVTRDANGNYQDTDSVKKMIQQSAPKKPTVNLQDHFMAKNPLTI